MPIQPDIGSVHVNRPLTNISVAFMQDAEAYVADRVWPNIPVDMRSDSYYVFDRKFWLRDDMKERSPGTESQGTGFETSTDSYLCKWFSLHTDIPDVVRANADSPINLDRENTSLLVNKALLKREKTWAAKALTGSSWTLTRTGVASGPTSAQFVHWSAAAADPVADVIKWKTEIQLTNFTGLIPNYLVIGQEVYDKLLTCPAILDRLKYGQTAGKAAQVTREAISQLFGLELFVGAAVEVTSAEGAGSVTAATVVGKSGLIGYRPSAAGLMTASSGYTFSWRGFTGMTAMGHRIKKMRADLLSSDRIEIDMAYDQKVISPDLGTFLATMIP